MDLTKTLRCVCLCLAGVCGRAYVSSIIFYNDPNARAATLYLSESIVAENIMVSEKVARGNSVDAASLTGSILEPEGYDKKVTKASREESTKTATYREAMTSYFRVDLKNVNFQSGKAYSFKIQPMNAANPIYSETFVCSNGNLMYQQEMKQSHWYTNIWVWCCVVLMVLIFLLLVKICCY